MKQIILLQNTLINRKRRLAGEVVEVSSDEAKHLVSLNLATIQGSVPEPEVEIAPELEPDAEDAEIEADVEPEPEPEPEPELEKQKVGKKGSSGAKK